MSGLCEQSEALNTVLQQRQRGRLQAVLVINAVMFVVVAFAAMHSGSTALLADSLDNLGDALTYGLSLYAVSRCMGTKARVALFKGLLIFLAACTVLAQLIYKLFVPSVPVFEIMGVFSVVGIVTNSLCVYLLWQHKNEDVNMSSVWECSRNDIVTNVCVLVTAGAVWWTGAAWPDLLVGLVLVVFLMRSAIRVMASAWTELRTSANGFVVPRLSATQVPDQSFATRK